MCQHLYHACNFLGLLPLCIFVRRVLERIESPEEPQLLEITYEGRDVLCSLDLPAMVSTYVHCKWQAQLFTYQTSSLFPDCQFLSRTGSIVVRRVHGARRRTIHLDRLQYRAQVAVTGGDVVLILSRRDGIAERFCARWISSAGMFPVLRLHKEWAEELE